MVQLTTLPGDLFGELAKEGGFLQEDYVATKVLIPLLQAIEYLHKRVSESTVREIH